MNNKKEESSVKLDLGKDESEEDQEEEDEEEEEEIVEEDLIEELEDEAPIDLDFNDDGDEQTNVVVNSPSKANEHFNTQPNNFMMTEPRAIKGKNPVKKNNLRDQYSTPKSVTMPKYFSTEPGFNRQKLDESKTVFTKVSEELFNKLINSKDSHGHKASAYDMLINDVFLNRICEREDKTSVHKFNDFVRRNLDFREKKSNKLREMEEKQLQEISAQCLSVPNGRKIEKAELRSPEDFMSDQIKYYTTRDLNVNMQRENILKSTDSELKKAPEISKKSKELAMKKERKAKKVHDRLYQEKLNKQKTHIIKEIKNKGKKEQTVKEVPLKSKEEIQRLVDKLFHEAKERKEVINNELSNKTAMKEFYKTYDSEDDLTSESTKRVILDKFVHNFQIALSDLFNKKDSHLINFDEYVSLITRLGFLKYDHSNITSEPIQGEKDYSRMKKDIEHKLIRNSWNILQNHSHQEEDKVDTNQLLIFSLSLLGIYKGENSTQENIDPVNNHVEAEPKEKSNEKNQSEFKHFKSFSLLTNKKFNSTAHSKNTKSLSMTNAFAKTNKTDSSKSQVNFIKEQLPELDISKYNYDKKTTKQIKIIFRAFYDNLVAFWANEANRKREEKRNKMKNKESVSVSPSKHSERFKRSVDGFRSRVFKLIEADNEGENADPTSENPPSPTKKLKLHEAYDILRKKKESDLVKQRQMLENEELKYCTFQPNVEKGVSKNVKEAIEKLYSTGVTKFKARMHTEEKRSPSADLSECTFRPSINEFNPTVFGLNPLEHDELIKKESERYEQARILKKIAEIQKKKGIMNLKQYKNFNSLLKEEEFPPLKFEIEKKKNKDSFDMYKKYDRLFKPDVSRQNFDKTIKFKSSNFHEKVPLLNIEVNIDDTHRIEKLEIFPDDDPSVAAENFCKLHGLSEDKKIRLQKIIEEKLKENTIELS